MTRSARVPDATRSARIPASGRGTGHSSSCRASRARFSACKLSTSEDTGYLLVAMLAINARSHHQLIRGAEAGSLVERDGSFARAEHYAGKVIAGGMIQQCHDEALADALVPVLREHERIGQVDRKST